MGDSDLIERWRRAGESGDADEAAECCAPGVVLISPLTDQFTFRGREQLRDLLRAAFSRIEGIEFHATVHDGATAALFYRARVGGTAIEEAQLLRLDDAGLIAEITLFGRPLPALGALMAELGPVLARQQDRPALARFLAASTAPLRLMINAGDKRVVPLAAPPD